MKRITLLLVAALLIAGALVPPAASAGESPACTDGDGDVALTRQQSWLQQADGKVGNAAAVGVDRFPTWSEMKPTRSVSDGAGGGYFANRYGDTNRTSKDPALSATFEGGFDGCLDTVAVELYLLFPAQALSDGHTLRARVEVDDACLYDEPIGQRVLTEVNPDGQGTYRVKFALTDLLRIQEFLGNSDVAVDGDHRIRLTVTPDDASTDDVALVTARSNMVYLYDATEVPSNLVFNGSTDGYTTIDWHPPLFPLGGGKPLDWCL